LDDVKSRNYNNEAWLRIGSGDLGGHTNLSEEKYEVRLEYTDYYGHQYNRDNSYSYKLNNLKKRDAWVTIWNLMVRLYFKESKHFPQLDHVTIQGGSQFQIDESWYGDYGLWPRFIFGEDTTQYLQDSLNGQKGEWLKNRLDQFYRSTNA
jgi:hypothetical protein